MGAYLVPMWDDDDPLRNDVLIMMIALAVISAVMALSP